MAGAKKELKDPSLHLYANFHYVYGRKPKEATEQELSEAAPATEQELSESAPGSDGSG
jgi:hypothetical protein